MSCISLAPTIPGCVNFPLTQGGTHEFYLDFEDVSLSDYDIIFEAKASRLQGAKVVMRKTVGDGLGVSGNRLTLSFGDETLCLAGQLLPYDILFVHKVDGTKEYWFVGNLSITPTIARQ